MRVWSVLGVLAAGATALGVACGGDDGAVDPSTCEGAACDDGGASSESSMVDSPSGTDGTTPSDAGVDGDADSAVTSLCADAGPPGTLDESFGDAGMVWLKYPGAQAKSVAIQSDGKIVVGGGVATRTFALVRLLPNGLLDPSFGTAGLVETKIAPTYNLTYDAVAVQADGKILAAGAADFQMSSRSYDFTVVRYMPDGSVDTTFGANGSTAIDFGSANFTADYPRSLAVLGDGRILVSGYSETGAVGSTDKFAVARLNADGTLDTTFGSGGKVSVDMRSTGAQPGAGSPLAGNKAIVVGYSPQSGGSSPNDLAAVQLAPDGALDPTFADAGKLLLGLPAAVPGAPGAVTVLVDPSGRLLLGGGSPSGADFMIARLTPSGGLDPTFGNAGVVATDFNGRSDSVNKLLLQDDGRVVAHGVSLLPNAIATAGIALARYLPNGALDTSFGSSGRVLTQPPPNVDFNQQAAAISGCRIVATGSWVYDQNTVPQFAMGVATYRR